MTIVALISTLWLACPPTAVPSSTSGLGAQFITVGSPLLRSFDDPDRGPPVAVPARGPEPSTLPLWDLDATMLALAERPEAEPDSEWLAWAVALSQARPAHAHGHLVRALASSELDASRLTWWLRHEPDPLDAHDALLAAIERSSDDRREPLLVAALALTHWTLSCPTELSVDGACRTPDDALFVRRDVIWTEAARRWTNEAQALRRATPFEPDDLAAAELFAELALAAEGEAYESLLLARMPDGLEFVVEEWRRDSGDPEWEWTYARQVDRVDESRARVDAYFATYSGCWSELSTTHGDAIGSTVGVGTRALLREATIMHTSATALEYVQHGRQRERESRETGERLRPGCWNGPTYADLAFEQALALADRCVELGTTVGGDTEVIEACRSLLHTIDDTRDRLTELVPEPRTTVSMQRVGVVGPAELAR